MSRIGRKPIALPKNVKVTVKDNMLLVEGPKGKLEHPIMPKITVEVTDNTVFLKRENDDKATRAFHGLMRAKLANMVKGVSDGFTLELELVGVGYRAELQGKDLNFTLGYSHPIKFILPSGVSAAVDKQTKISLTSIDKELLGQTAANILGLRKVDIYKGKGVRRAGQFIKLKPGKTAAKK
ncbi:MAG: 50S ribosomal protein L6 [Proteobacteria bacterium]|nr:50S ribosomal protein L6 [Pseudomonadota bacterium]